MDDNQMINDNLTAYQYNPNQPYRPEDIYAKPGEDNSADGFAIASLVCGILSLITCCCYGIGGIVFGTAAIVLACIAARRNMGRMPGLAIAGLVCGILGVVFGLIYLLIILLGVMWGT